MRTIVFVYNHKQLFYSQHESHNRFNAMRLLREIVRMLLRFASADGCATQRSLAAPAYDEYS